jgi:sacsin
MANGDKLAKVMLQENVAIVNVTEAVAAGFEKVAGALQPMSPKVMRARLKEPGEHPSLAEPEKVHFLLEYCLADLKETQYFKDLVGLPLLPLADGSFARFDDVSAATEYFVCTDPEHSLLAAMQNRLVAKDVGSELAKLCLSASMLHDVLNVKPMDATVLASNMHLVLPESFFGLQEVVWTPGEAGHPTREWISAFWAHCQDKVDPLMFCSWPLLPTEQGCLCRLERSSRIMDGSNLNANLNKILGGLGCRILDCSLIERGFIPFFAILQFF